MPRRPLHHAALSVLACTVTGMALAAPALTLPGCTTPVPGITSCMYVLRKVKGKPLPQVLPNTAPYENRVMPLTAGVLRLNTGSPRLGAGKGTYSLEWSWLDKEKNLKNTANDVGSYTTDAAGHFTFTSMGKAVYTGVLNGGLLSLTGVPVVTETFEGRVALTFAVK